METSAQLTEAWDLLLSGRFRDSLIPFSQAAGDFRCAAEALYGIGVAQLSLHEDVYAEAALWDSLQRAPLNAEALFYLGLIAERRGRRQEAIGRYRETLAMAGDHAGARVRLAAVQSGSGVRPSVVPLPASRPPAPPALARPAPRPARPSSGPADVEEVERLQQAVALSARPRVIAYLGSLDPEVLAPLPVHPATAALLVAFWFGLALLRSPLPFLAAFITVLQVAAGAGAVLQVLGLALTGVRAARMRVTIRQGRVQVDRDLLKPGVVTGIDLAGVDRVELRRTGLQPLTGDGTLALTGRDGTVLLCGIARGSRLTHLYRQLLELVEHLHGW